MAAASAPSTDRPAPSAARHSTVDSAGAFGGQNWNKPNVSDAQLVRIIDEISSVARMPRRISAIQIDFDARKSERGFYRDLLGHLRSRLPAGLPLSITALASWCVYDNWIGDLPVDDAVPMLFRMGVDDLQVRLHLEAGRDFQPEICRQSLGVSIDEPLRSLPAGRRLYVFNPKRWSPEAVRNLQSRQAQ